jgi:soluble lytic murein transglycosylase-like protein
LKLNSDWKVFMKRARNDENEKKRKITRISVWCLVAAAVVSIFGAALVSVVTVGPVPAGKLVASGWLGTNPAPAPASDPQLSIYDYIHSFNTGLSDAEEHELASLVYFESVKYGYDPEFILAIIQTESEFNPEAVSNKGACGLMQLMPATASMIAHEVKIPYEGKSALSNPYVNVRMGTYYLFKMMLQFKDVRLALVAYNCGPGFVEEMTRRGAKLPEDYVEKVMGNYEKIKIQGL